MKRVFVNRNNSITITCPACNKTKTIDVSQYLQTPKAVKINCRCSCEHKFSVLVERRKHIRNDTRIYGKAFQITSPDIKRHAIHILDISQSGLKFTPLSGATHDFQIGERLRLEFTLDDNNKSFVRREVIIQNINGPVLGTEFAAKEHYDALGAYIRFNLT